MIRIGILAPFLGQQSLQIRRMDRIGLLLYQVFNTCLLLVTHSLSVLSDSPLSHSGRPESILDALLDAILLIHGQSRLHLIQQFLVFLHHLQS